MSEKQTIAILGSGNIGLSLARGLVKAGIYQPDQIILTRLRPTYVEFAFQRLLLARFSGQFM